MHLPIDLTAPAEKVHVRGYYDDQVLLTEHKAMTWCQIPTVPYGFRGDRREIGWTASMALARLKKGDLHLISRPRSTDSPTSLAGWGDERLAHVRKYGDPSPRYEGIVRAANKRMIQQQPYGKQVFMGVELGRRSALEQLRERTHAMDTLTNQRDLAGWTQAADDTRDALHRGALHADPVSASWLRQLRQHIAYRGLPVPEESRSLRRFFGHRETQDEFAGVGWQTVTFPTRRGLRTALKVTSPTSGDQPVYSASWLISVMPTDMLFPDTPPWLAHGDGLPFPVEVHGRMRLVPAKQALAKIKRRLSMAREQASDADFARIDLPIETEQILSLAREWEYRIPTSRMPMVFGHVVLRVDAPSPQLLEQMFQQAEERYGELGIDLAWPGGMAQRDLLLGSIPGSQFNFKSFEQMWPIETVGCGLMHAGSGLSQRTGFYPGFTTGNRQREVVCWDPHWAIRRSAEQGDRHVEAQGGTGIVGAQRSGKSNAVITTAWEHCEAGMEGVLVDFGGETSRLEKIAPDRVEVVDVLTAGGGSADPMSNAVVPGDSSDPDVRRMRERLTYSTLRTLAHQHVTTNADADTALRQAIRHVSTSASESSTAAVLEILRNSGEKAASNLGDALHFDLSTSGQGAVILGESRKGAAPKRKPLTILTGKGMVMADAGKPLIEWTADEALGGAVFGIVAHRARHLLWGLPPGSLSLALIDEAHVALATPAGRQVISDLLRHGPKNGVATILSTHNAEAMSETWIANSLSTIMLFRSSSEVELSQGLDLAQVPNTKTNRDLRRGFENGECLMVMPGDVRDRMKWDRWHPGLTDVANTTAGRRDLVAA